MLIDMVRTGPTNPVTKEIAQELISRGYKENSKFMIEVARLIQLPTRKRIEVNLNRLQRVCKENDTIVVPGKVLSYGILTKPLTVSALSFSKEAERKILEAGGKVLSLHELISGNPKGIRLIK